MRAGKRKLLVMRISDRKSSVARCRALIAASLLVVGTSLALPAVSAHAAPAPGAVEYASPQDALVLGVEAFKDGNYADAIPPLQFAAERNLFLAQFYLARIYGDNDRPFTDHAKAYVFYQQIARDFADVEPDDERAEFVARSLVALAGYVRRGLPEISLDANRRRAAGYLEWASNYFNNEDAQFELAKMMLQESDEHREDLVRRGLDWLSTLSQRGYAGAQAFLADLLWRGKFTKADPVRALALIAVASKNAPEKDRLWIDDIYQNVYCGASEGVRRQATGLVAEWDSRYGRKPRPPGMTTALGSLSVTTVRTCADGEKVNPLNGQLKPGGLDHPTTFVQSDAVSGYRGVNEKR